jgi:hypothetical protein
VGSELLWENSGVERRKVHVKQRHDLPGFSFVILRVFAVRAFAARSDPAPALGRAQSPEFPEAL